MASLYLEMATSVPYERHIENFRHVHVSGLQISLAIRIVGGV